MNGADTAGSNWIRDTLLNMATPQAERYLGDDRRITKLDRIIEGLSPERGAELLRVVVNLGIDPDDPAWVLVSAIGYFARIGETLPKETKDVLDRINDAIEKFDDNETAAAKARNSRFEVMAKDLESKAVTMAHSSMESAFVEEDAKLRRRLTSAMEASFKDFGTKLLSQRSQISKEQTRSLGMAALIVTFVFAGGVWAGGAIGYGRATSSGAVSDPVYRLEQLGAGWEAYRGTLSQTDRARADGYIHSHAVYLPNPR
jgi:hypothetical protein